VKSDPYRGATIALLARLARHDFGEGERETWMVDLHRARSEHDAARERIAELEAALAGAERVARERCVDRLVDLHAAARERIAELERDYDLARRYGFCHFNPDSAKPHTPRPTPDADGAYCAACGKALGLETLSGEESSHDD